MTILSVTAGNPGSDGEVRVELSDGSSLSLSEDYLPGEFASLLRETGRGLADHEEEALCFAAACRKAEKAALRLVARAEQCSLGITAKLERRGHDAAAVKTVISRFLERNLLDDERYAGCWIRSRLFKKAQSPRRMLISLGKKGISRNSSLAALAKILDPDTEFALLSRFIENQGAPEDLPSRAQLKFEAFSAEVLDRFFDSF